MELKFLNDSVVKAQDIFDDLPTFMKRADVVFTDLPYNQSLLTNYSNREGVVLNKNNTKEWKKFINRFFECVDQIRPNTLFVEIGKQNLEQIKQEVSKRFIYVQVFQSSYYNKNACYVVCGSIQPITFDFNGIDEKRIIEKICKELTFECIGDLCMGKGLVGFYAYKYGKSFVGIELNKKRLIVLKERIEKGHL